MLTFFNQINILSPPSFLANVVDFKTETEAIIHQSSIPFLYLPKETTFLFWRDIQ